MSPNYDDLSLFLNDMRFTLSDSKKGLKELSVLDSLVANTPI